MAEKPVDKPMHVVKVPLIVNAREAMILDQRLRVTGQIYNAVLGEMLKRADALKRDPEWAKARLVKDDQQRSRAYKWLRAAHGLVDSRSCVNAAHAHWKASKWMSDVVTNTTPLAVGLEVWPIVNEYLLTKRERPVFKKSADRDTSWGASMNEGLRLSKSGSVIWHSRTRRKNLELTLDWKTTSGQYQKRITGRKIKRVGITRELVRGKMRYWALINIEGHPYRDPEYLKLVDVSSIAVIDAGPSTLAVVSRDAAEIITLAPPAKLKEMQTRHEYIKRQKRKLDRSLRAANPQTYEDQHERGAKKGHGKGKSKKGVRKTERSKTYERRRNQLKENERHLTAQKRAREREAARVIIAAHGAIIGMEDVTYIAWQRLWGRRVLLTAPGALRDALRRQCAAVGGSFIELPTRDLALSQHCLCGAKAKKPLSQRYHACSECGLGMTGTVLDRDLFSAFLGRYCLLHDIQNFEGSAAIPAAPSTRSNAVSLCSRTSTSTGAAAAGGSPSIIAHQRDDKLGSGRAGSENVAAEASARPSRPGPAGSAHEPATTRPKMAPQNAPPF